MGKLHRWRLQATVLTFVVLGVAAASTAGGASSDHAQKTPLPKKTIGVMGPVNAAEIIKLGTDATVAAAKALGWKTIQVDPLGDPAKMGAGMTSLVNSKVDAIVLTTIEPATIQAGLRAAKKAGIPVIDTHTQTTSSPLFAGEYFLSPPKEFALLEARMKRDLPRGSEIGTINLPQFLNAKIAGDLMKKAAQRNGWKIVAQHDADLANLVADTQKSVGDMIRANAGIDAIWGCCDFAPAGAIPAIRSSGKAIKIYALHGIPSVIPQLKSGLVVVEVAEYQKGSLIAIDELAAFFANGDPIAKKTPKQFAYKQTIVGKANASKGYPYATAKMLAPFKARWARLYQLPAK
ncbi:MAG TPA: substrate-binding domain-containing protein [Gaiellaceae bacterium]|nr:substrate-binding domain-containing protein [Gaiellaceae bacterium]HLE98754.1 substrate-binding domain-containing protein [Gaiellaceae bacterium]